MLSRPRKPPSKTFVPSRSSRLIHHVKLTDSLSKTRLRKPRSRAPSIANTSSAAHACTGGLTSSNDHSYAASAPFGCWNHSRQRRIIWYFANAGATGARATQWKARAHAANHGDSHFSGSDILSGALNVGPPELRPRDA